MEANEIGAKYGQRNQSSDFARREAVKMATNHNRIARTGTKWEPLKHPVRTEQGWMACIVLWETV